MKLDAATIEFGGQPYALMLGEPIDLSWPISFQSEDASAFSLPGATTKPVELGTFIGDTNQGGSVNCHTLVFTPHGNGTHTEGVGHLLDSHDAVLPSLRGEFSPALVLTVETSPLGETADTYAGASEAADSVISADALRTARQRLFHGLARRTIPSEPFASNSALIIRTSQDPAPTRPPQFSSSNPPYFTTEAMELLTSWNPPHLGTDLPSVDREQCGGRTPNHRLYWKLQEEHSSGDHAARRHATITEMINPRFDAIDDDAYFVQIHAAPWLSDAVLTRPFLYRFSHLPSS